MRRKGYRPTWRGLMVGLLAWTALVPGPAEAGDAAAIRGTVLDSSGAPLAAALVSVQSVDSVFRERLVFTDRAGVFSVSGLIEGKYVVKVTKSSFLPVVATGVELLAGTDAVLTVNLQTALDVAQRRGVRRGLEDMKWILRSSASTRPGLRHNPADSDSTENPLESFAPKDTSGYFQVHSTSLETSAGPTDLVGSQFEVTLPLARDSEVTFSGQLAEASDQPQGFGASYEFSKSERQRSSVAVNVRQGAFFNDASAGTERREINLEYGERLQWSDRLVLGYGATVGRAEGVQAHNYIRPELSATWTPTAHSAIHAAVSTRSPTDMTDPIRGHEYFDRPVDIPASLESFGHAEIGATYFLSDAVQVSAAAFRDRFETQAFLIDSEDGRRGIMIFSTTDAPSGGVRVNLDRTFRDFEAGIGYTYVNAVGFDEDIPSPEALTSQASRRDIHVVTARIKADLDLTQTAVTAVYRWASGFSLTPMDPYQSFAEYNDPTLSITVAQDLPHVRALPASFQAVVDARNLFEPSFGTRRTVYAGYPRLLRGGIHIKF